MRPLLYVYFCSQILLNSYSYSSEKMEIDHTNPLLGKYENTLSFFRALFMLNDFLKIKQNQGKLTLFKEKHYFMFHAKKKKIVISHTERVYSFSLDRILYEVDRQFLNLIQLRKANGMPLLDICVKAWGRAQNKKREISLVTWGEKCSQQKVKSVKKWVVQTEKVYNSLRPMIYRYHKLFAGLKTVLNKLKFPSELECSRIHAFREISRRSYNEMRLMNHLEKDPLVLKKPLEYLDEYLIHYCFYHH